MAGSGGRAPGQGGVDQTQHRRTLAREAESRDRDGWALQPYCPRHRRTAASPARVSIFPDSGNALSDALNSSVGFIPLDSAQAEAASLLCDLHLGLRAAPARRPRQGLLGRWVLGRRPPLDPVRGLYLWGGVGRGKTHLMDWFVDNLPLPGKRRVHFHHFMHDIHAAMANLPKQPDPLEVVAEREAAQTRVLCLDEFAVSDITDAMILYGLLRALFARGVTLVTTSNTQPQCLYRNGLQRQRFLPAIELLERHTRIFELDGGIDYRLRTLTAAGVVFLAGDGSGDVELAACFERLTGGHAVRETAYSVNGRQVPVRGMGSDVVWFDFDTLCGGPRATADYIEIAREFHTVLLSGVPVLAPRYDAAARRLLHLVDELYDRRVKLILSAAAPVEDLYAGGLHDFAYARLLSRLTEMQSLEYLAAAGPGAA
jgi:cell division protein ZapE